MATTMKLVRRPRTRKMWPVIKKELTHAYQAYLYPAVAEKYREVGQFDQWTEEPEIKMRTKVSRHRYVVSFHADARTKIGRIFLWVDYGTMDEGNPATTYSIEPVNADFLRFQVPYQPYTYPPAPDVLNYDPTAAPEWITKMRVDHPGIKPRRITEQVLKWVKDRRNTRGFYRITENAYRRGFRAVKRASGT